MSQPHTVVADTRIRKCEALVDERCADAVAKGTFVILETIAIDHSYGLTGIHFSTGAAGGIPPER
jgi:hypothetical protein